MAAVAIEKANYSRVSNKRGGTIINFHEIFHPTRSYSIPYVYSFHEKIPPITIISYHVLFPTKISSNITQGLQHFFLFSVIATEYLYNNFPKGGKFTVNPLQWHILFDRSPLCTTLYQYYRGNFHAILFFHPTRLLIL